MTSHCAPTPRGPARRDTSRVPALGVSEVRGEGENLPKRAVDVAGLLQPHVDVFVAVDQHG